MAIKIVIFFALVVVSQAGVLIPTAYYAAPTILTKIAPVEEPANYQFEYGVNDAISGDFKSQSERSDNGAVKGSYQLNDADGFLRIVDYSADDVHGFQATVRREPLKVKQFFAEPIVRLTQAVPYISTK